MGRGLVRGRRVGAVADLWEAIAAGDEDAVREHLANRPEAAGTRNAAGLSPVLHALYNGRRAVADILLEANPPLDVFDAAAVGRTRGLEELLDADPELARAWSPDGFTPLHLAAFFGQADAVELLLQHEAEVDVVARNADIHVAPLHSAASGGHAEIVKRLLEHGADPNAAQDGGFTPLHSAAQNDDRDSVEALLAAGADPARANDEGKRPADLAGDSVRELLG